MQKTILCFWEEYEWDPGARHKNLFEEATINPAAVSFSLLLCVLSWKFTISLFRQTDRGEHQLIAWGFRKELTGNGQPGVNRRSKNRRDTQTLFQWVELSDTGLSFSCLYCRIHRCLEMCVITILLSSGFSLHLWNDYLLTLNSYLQRVFLTM